MCQKIKTISRNNYGDITYCGNCKFFYLKFINIFFEFNDKDLLSFTKSINLIDPQFWESKYEQTLLRRRIPVKTKQENLFLMFNQEEFYALKNLLNRNRITDKKLSLIEIDYTLILN